MIYGIAPEKIQRAYTGMFAVGAKGQYPPSAMPPGDPPPMGGEGGEGGPPPMGGPGAVRGKPSFPSARITADGVQVDQPRNVAGALGSSEAEGITLAVRDDGYTGGVTVEGIPYALRSADIRLDGNGISLGGPGSGVCADKGSDVTLRGCHIETNGSARCATSAENDSVLRVYDSTLISHGAPFGSELPPGAFMATPPEALEIDGNCRTHLTMRGSESYFYNSIIQADGWAALSTDISDGWVYLEANDCQVITVNSGYGVYADGGCHDVLNRCKFRVASMAAIAAGESDVTFRDCTGQCGSYLALIHCIGMPKEVTELNVFGGSFHTKAPAILLKSANALLHLEGTEIVSDSGVLIRSIYNVDPNAGNAADPNEPVVGIRATLKDMTVSGDVLHEDFAKRPMYLRLENASLTGAIRNAWISLDAASRWTATADSTIYPDGTLDPAQVDAPAGVTVTVCGAQEGAGTYSLASGGTMIVT